MMLFSSNKKIFRAFFLVFFQYMKDYPCLVLKGHLKGSVSKFYVSIETKSIAATKELMFNALIFSSKS